MNSHVSCAKAKIIITLNGHPGCLCLFTHVTYFQMISLLNHPTSIMPSPLISRRLSQKSPLTFLYSLKTTMKAKPRLFANFWTLLLYLIKKNKICAQGSFFFNSLIHWNETVSDNKKYLWMHNCRMDLWMSEFSFFQLLEEYSEFSLYQVIRCALDTSMLQVKQKTKVKMPNMVVILQSILK